MRLLAEIKSAQNTHSKVAEGYNEQREAQTKRKRELLTAVWDTYDAGQPIGAFALRKDYAEHIGLSPRHIERLVAAERSLRAGREPKKQTPSCRLIVGKIVTVGEGKASLKFCVTSLPTPEEPRVLLVQVKK